MARVIKLLLSRWVLGALLLMTLSGSIYLRCPAVHAEKPQCLARHT